MRPFTYDALPGRVVFGPGASRDKLREEVEDLGSERVLLVATEREEGLARELAEPLEEKLAGTFMDVRPHVPVEVAERAREKASEVRADCLLSVGGGSTTGTAKAIALETGLPIVAVPTTYAGSEMTPVYGLTSSQRKQTGASRRVLPRVVIYDPELTLTLPDFITGPSAINAVAHCVEAFYSSGANPITSLMAEEGIDALATGVRVAVHEPEELEGRTRALYGAYLAGAAFAATGGGLHHKVCHVLGGSYDLPHAETHTVILPQVIAFNARAIPEIMDRIAGALGTEEAATGVFDLVTAIGGPTALKDVGMREKDLDEAVDLVLEEAPQDNPRPVDESGIRGLLQAAYTGQRPFASVERST